jgi:hypothetical protein
MCRFATGLLLSIFCMVPALHAQAHNPYPNELRGLKFYAKYLSPLRPGESDTKQIVQILGSDQGKELTDWRIGILFSCKEDFTVCSHGPRNDPLADMVIMPKHRVRMGSVKFPVAFKHSLGGASEINRSFDVYTDKYGLEYWIEKEDSPAALKGDLYEIRYRLSEESQKLTRDHLL